MEYKVFTALHSIKKKDNSEFRALLFFEFRKKYKLSQFFYLAYNHSLWRKPVVILLIIYSLRKLFSVSFKQKEKLDEIYIYNYANEKKSILNTFANSHSSCELTYISTFNNFIKNFKILSRYLFNWHCTFRFVKICLKLSNKNSFLVTARQIEFLTLYVFFKHLFQKSVFKEVYISSESNPEIISAALACTEARINYTNHGYLNKDLGLFFHDKLVLDSRPLKARIQPHLFKKNVEIEIIKKTQAALFVREISTQNILILGSLVLDINSFFELIKDCRKNLIDSHITIRFHPNKIFADRQFTDLCNKFKILIQPNTSLKEQLSQSTLVIAGETSAHLDALAQGVPSIYYRLDRFPQDHYGFISSGLIPEVKSLYDLKNSVQKFYSNPEWLKVYKDYFGE